MSGSSSTISTSPVIRQASFRTSAAAGCSAAVGEVWRAPGGAPRPTSGSGAVGSFSVTLAPGSTAASVRPSSPPCSSMIWSTIARPRPVPFSRRSRRARSTGRGPAGRPTPLSSISNVVPAGRGDGGRVRMIRLKGAERLARRRAATAFAGILQEVGQRLADHPARRRTAGVSPVGSTTSIWVGAGIGDALGEYRLAQQLGGAVRGRELRRQGCGRTPENSSTIRLDVADLPDDGVGAAVEGLEVARQLSCGILRCRSADSWIGVIVILIFVVRSSARRPSTRRCVERLPAALCRRRSARGCRGCGRSFRRSRRDSSSPAAYVDVLLGAAWVARRRV